MLGFSVLDRGKFGFWRLRGGFNMGCDGSFGGREAKDAEDGWWISVKRGNFGMTTTGALITDFMLLTSYSWRMVTSVVGGASLFRSAVMLGQVTAYTSSLSRNLCPIIIN